MGDAVRGFSGVWMKDTCNPLSTAVVTPLWKATRWERMRKQMEKISSFLFKFHVIYTGASTLEAFRF